MAARIITRDELQQEAARRTIKCSGCHEHVRYVNEDRVTSPDRKRRYVVCPCGHECGLAFNAQGGL